MTVSELIEELKKLDGNAEVYRFVPWERYHEKEEPEIIEVNLEMGDNDVPEKGILIK